MKNCQGVKIKGMKQKDQTYSSVGGDAMVPLSMLLNRHANVHSLNGILAVWPFMALGGRQSVILSQNAGDTRKPELSSPTPLLPFWWNQHGLSTQFNIHSKETMHQVSTLCDKRPSETQARKAGKQKTASEPILPPGSRTLLRYERAGFFANGNGLLNAGPILKNMPATTGATQHFTGDSSKRQTAHRSLIRPDFLPSPVQPTEAISNFIQQRDNDYFSQPSKPELRASENQSAGLVLGDVKAANEGGMKEVMNKRSAERQTFVVTSLHEASTISTQQIFIRETLGPGISSAVKVPGRSIMMKAASPHFQLLTTDEPLSKKSATDTDESESKITHRHEHHLSRLNLPLMTFSESLSLPDADLTAATALSSSSGGIQSRTALQLGTLVETVGNRLTEIFDRKILNELQKVQAERPGVLQKGQADQESARCRPLTVSDLDKDEVAEKFFKKIRDYIDEERFRRGQL